MWTLWTGALVAGFTVLAGCAAEVAADDEPTPKVAVETATITRRTLHGYVEAYGVIQGAPVGPEHAAASASISAASAGLVTRVLVHEGQEVARRAPLLALDDRVAAAAVQEARQRLEKARHAETLAAQTLKRLRKLGADGFVPQRRLQEAEQGAAAAAAEAAASADVLSAAQTKLKLFHVTAPLAGTVTRILVKPGESVTPGVPVVELLDLERLVVVVDVPSREASQLKLNQPLLIAAPTQGGDEAVKSAVSFISPGVNPLTDTVAVRAPLPAGAPLRPGQLVDVRIVVEERVDRLAVPVQSVYTDEDGRSTLSLVEDGKAKQVEVRVGLRDRPWVEVEGEGLVEGAPVVTVGAYALPDGVRVKVSAVRAASRSER